jgi:endonuclease/exonuclease/phosphatase family metal-dependent hydrolase
LNMSFAASAFNVNLSAASQAFRSSRLVPLLLILTACASGARRSLDVGTLPCRQVIPDAERSVSWISPAADRDRIKLEDWCSVVGPVLYEPDPAPASGGEVRPVDRLAIVSWNTHVGGGDLDSLVRRVRAGEFTAGEPFHHVVLLLQEMYRSGEEVPAKPTLRTAIPGRIAIGSHESHDRDIRRVASTRGLAVLYAPSMRNGLVPDDPEDRGNAILSTMPLSDPAVIELPFERQRRVAAVATIGGTTSAGGSWRLRLANVHLDTALALTRGGPLRARRRQVEALIRELSDAESGAADTRDGLLVAGDFNAWLGEREPAIDALRRAFPDAPPVRGPTWIGPFGLRATLDYVFARGELRGIHVQRLPHRFGSDHFPLLTVVDF